jgi:hypothetical protein
MSRRSPQEKAMIDLTDLLPEGHKPRQRKTPKVDLSEFFDQGPPPEPEIFSLPLALELHVCRTMCRCGETFLAPEAAFVEVVLKKLHYVGYHHYYKEAGHVLIPINAERSSALASIPHRVRYRDHHVVVCHLCLERADLYKDSQVESHHEWEVRRPKLYSQAWKEYQMEVAPSKTRLLELIEQIERREAQKDDRPFQVGVVGQIYNRMLDEENRDE